MGKSARSKVAKYTYTPRDDEKAQSPSSIGPVEGAHLSIQILYPLLFTLLLIASLGVNIVLSTLSHLSTVNTLVEDVHAEVGSRIVVDVTNFFDVAANAVGDLRSMTESRVLEPWRPHLVDAIPGNGPFMPFATRYLSQHPEIFDVTIATDTDLIEYIENHGRGEFLYYVRNGTTAPDRWTFAVTADGKYVNDSHIVKYIENFVVTRRSWYNEIKANPRSHVASSWSSPYLWSDKSAIGMFCGGTTFDDSGNVVGVIGGDIIITKTTEFFSSIGLKGGFAFLLANDGRVFASSLVNVSFAEEGGNGELILRKILDAVNEDEHPNVIGVTQDLERRLGGLSWVNLTLSDTIDGNAVYIAPVLDAARSGLHVLVVLPLGPFRDEVTSDVLVSTFIAVALLVVSAAVAIGFSITLTRPLARSTLTLNRCAALDIDDLGVGTRSWVKEIASLQDSTASLLAALHSFALYIPKGVVKSLMENKRAAVAEMEAAELGIFFCDIANFTDISHQLSASDTSRLLAQYFSIITHHLEESSATTDKFLGDGVLAFWGAPEPVLHRSKHALETLLRIEEDVRKHRETSEKAIDGLPTPGLRIGIHDGPCIVGNIGTSTRLNYTVIGDAVNLASRLESLSKFFRTSHLVSARVVEGCPQDFVARKVAIVTVKGRSEPTTVMNVLVRSIAGAEDLARAESLKDKYETALALFTRGDFVAASRSFRQCALEFTDDGPSAVMADLADEYAKKVPENWRGYIVMDSK